MITVSLPPETWHQWRHDFPVRHLLVQNATGEDVLWARAAAAEGLFLDPVPLPREVLVIGECEPAGALRASVTEGRWAPLSLGNVLVDVRDGIRSAEVWLLEDMTVLAHRPSAADPSLFDIVVGAGIEEADEYRTGPHLDQPEFRLIGGQPYGTSRRLDGLRRPRPDPPLTPVTLIGCEPHGLQDVLDNPDHWRGNGVGLCTLDLAGRLMDRRYISTEITDVHPSVLGADLIDVTFLCCSDPPTRAARPVWELWSAGVPTEKNTWARFPAEGRREWLHLLRSGYGAKRVKPVTGGVYHLDGRHVTDVPGFHCAIGEAMAGPAGIFGREYETFKDFLFGLRDIVPVELVWHDSEVARLALAEARETPEGRGSYFDEMVEIMRGYRVTVVLD